ncbi:MAG: SanA/YdcF family protein [Bacteroidia bacterium]
MQKLKKIIGWFFNSRLKRWCLLWLPITSLLLIALCNFWIESATEKQIYSNVNDVPARNVALVLGASPRTPRGNINLYFRYRMEAAAQLYLAKKVKHIIVSGDNHIVSYDESTAMKQALVSLGVPDSCITLDFAGFRTLDSVVRCRDVFGQSSVIIVSQEFHNQRALFIANSHKLDAVAYNAKDVPANYSLKTRLREYLARVNAVLDVKVINRKPKFGGPAEPIKF